MRRRTFRLIATLCIVLAPTLGAQLVIARYDELQLVPFLLTSTFIWSVIVHLSLFDLFAARGREKSWRTLLISMLCLAVLPGMPLMPFQVFPGGDIGKGNPQIATLFLWISGLTAALVTRAVWKLLPQRLILRPVPLSNMAQLIIAAVVLSICFLTGLALLPLIEGKAPTLPSISVVIMSALYALTASALCIQGLQTLMENDDDIRPAPVLMVMSLLATLALLALIMALPEIAPIGKVGGTVTVLLMAILAAIILVREPVVRFAAGIQFILATLVFDASHKSGGPVLQGIFLLLLIVIMFVISRVEPGDRDPVARVGQPPAAAVVQFHSASQTWIARIDLDEQTMRFPPGTAASLGCDDMVKFDEIFSGSDFSGLIDLIQLLRAEPPLPVPPVRIQLTRSGQKDNRPALITVDAHILSVQMPQAWIALVSLEREKDMAARLAHFEKLLGETVLREERLLSIASHELRTPIAILSMLGEELKSGSEWGDIEASFEKTLNRIIAILDDLRAGGATDGGPGISNGFTIREMAQQIMDIFGMSAVGNGITLEFAASENSDVLLRCDHSRVLIALSKLVHNAILHSRGKEVMISAFLTKGVENDCVVTWQIADDGIGVARERRRQIFEPFETGTANPDGLPGLGLYAARKAIRLIGGELVLGDEDGKGSRFILTHPARITSQPALTEHKVASMNDITPLYSDRSVLLIEDNKLVGEITSARLRKLFQRVDWSEAGDAGLELYRQNRYDMLIVDQLLPGLIGSEIVREIRRTDKNLPIIGITASTMGSECRDLEEAGANYALEKPLSFGQLKALAEEFFPNATPEGS